MRVWSEVSGKSIAAYQSSAFQMASELDVCRMCGERTRDCTSVAFPRCRTWIRVACLSFGARSCSSKVYSEAVKVGSLQLNFYFMQMPTFRTRSTRVSERNFQSLHKMVGPKFQNIGVSSLFNIADRSSSSHALQKVDVISDQYNVLELHLTFNQFEVSSSLPFDHVDSGFIKSAMSEKSQF